MFKRSVPSILLIRKMWYTMLQYIKDDSKTIQRKEIETAPYSITFLMKIEP